jgi:hypothetical protein
MNFKHWLNDRNPIARRGAEKLGDTEFTFLDLAAYAVCIVSGIGLVPLAVVAFGLYEVPEAIRIRDVVGVAFVVMFLYGIPKMIFCPKEPAGILGIIMLGFSFASLFDALICWMFDMSFFQLTFLYIFAFVAGFGYLVWREASSYRKRRM